MGCSCCTADVPDTTQLEHRAAAGAERCPTPICVVPSANSDGESAAVWHSILAATTSCMNVWGSGNWLAPWWQAHACCGHAQALSRGAQSHYNSQGLPAVQAVLTAFHGRLGALAQQHDVILEALANAVSSMEAQLQREPTPTAPQESGLDNDMVCSR